MALRAGGEVRYKAVLEYDGTAFHGWQKQKNAVGIQNLLEEKLAVLFREKLRVEGASRTDAGVHARGQVIAFSPAADKDPSLILRGLNGLLPQSIRAREVSEVPEIFDPRRDAASKEYRYTWWAHPAHSPFWRRFSWHAREGLDDKAMAEAAQAILGEHDFSAFRAAGCTAKSPVRRILESGIRRKGERVQFVVKGHAFLYQMVRILAGTLYDIGQGRRPPSEMARVLAGKDRKIAGKTAPAEGLCLWEIAYGEIPRPGRVLRQKP